jgi:hypothetical protein
MTTAKHPRKVGEPIAVLAVVLICWVLARSVLWQSPFAEITEAVSEFTTLASVDDETLSADAPSPLQVAGAPLDRTATPHRTVFALTDRSMAQPINNRLPSAERMQLATSHHLLWMAALSLAPISPEVAALAGRSNEKAKVLLSIDSSSFESKLKRWSIDSWVFFRPEDSLVALLGQLPATYGSSQAGGIIRYRLAPKDKRKPFAYLRGSAALSRGRQAELAAGLGARPVASIPIVAMAELRASRNPGQTEIRPAGLVVTELPPVDLPLGGRAEVYAQAGYVGGAFATPFVDGQARIDRKVVDFDLASIRAGAGVWGGAQKGAARLDVGPTASVNFELADQPIKLALDYRQRVAGDARPQSGFALTVSTGF